MAKEEEFAMIEELSMKNDIEIELNTVTSVRIISHNAQDGSSLSRIWNKNEFKAFIDELLVLHSKMK